MPTRIPEKGCVVMWSFGGKPLKDSGRFGPERAYPILSSFAVKTDLSGLGEMKVFGSDCQGFADACSGIVEEQQRPVVAETKRSPNVGLGENSLLFFRLEVACT